MGKPLDFVNKINTPTTKFGVMGSKFVRAFDKKHFFQVYNSNTKSSFLVMWDGLDANKGGTRYVVFNLNTNKVEKTIYGNKIIFPAKEGHIMIASFDIESGKSSYSIESL